MGACLITRYFPDIDPVAADRFEQLEDLYTFWNARINVISRKDLSNLYVNHVLHSLSLARVIPFGEKETVLDIGTGGGFPGIPLAVLFSEVHFTLIDSIRKKIKVVDNIVSELRLKNVSTAHVRAEDLKGSFHYIVSRAVCSFSGLVALSDGKIRNDISTIHAHGIYSLKGGDFHDELDKWKDKVKIFDVSSFFREEFFKTKSIVFLPAREIPADFSNDC